MRSSDVSPGKHVFLGAAACLALAACGGEANAGAEAAGGAMGADAAGAGSAFSAQGAAGGQASAPKSEQAAIFKAAGFTKPKGDNQWAYPENECDSVYAEIVEYRDLNGDGVNEAVVQFDDDQCLGMNQRHYLVLTKASSAWKVVGAFGEYFGVYEFYPRKNITWPDIEISNGMEENPGCVDFLRWDGDSYELAGTADEGKICSLDPGFHDSDKPAKPAATAGTVVAFPPMEKGFYARGVSCQQTTQPDNVDLLTYLDDKKWVGFDGGVAIRNFTSLGANRYRVKMDGDEVTITLDGKGGFVREEDDVQHNFCPTSQVPASSRQEILSMM